MTLDAADEIADFWLLFENSVNVGKGGKADSASPKFSRRTS
jgi:hypothetical protein